MTPELSPVAVARLPEASYPSPEAPESPLRDALSRLTGALHWRDDQSALGAIIPEGARVVVKPNLVLHENLAGAGLEPLLTHSSIIRLVVHELLRSGAGRVLVGDAPVQGCDWGELRRVTGLGEWAGELQAKANRFAGLVDFRRTRSTVRAGVREAEEDLLPLDQFVLFDLAGESLLEPVTQPGIFRVTQYDPDAMARTHAPGRHQYLVAREVIEADVIVNLPKLKTHKKAGITCALKNLIGINGNKEFLPHHRVGGSDNSGDCYPGDNAIKRALERSLDRLNQSQSYVEKLAWSTSARALHKAAVMAGDVYGVEGSWSGNDTIWRTCLDLNRILLYGRVDGTLSDAPQRRVISLVDAIVAGKGDGPLSPQRLDLGLFMAGDSSPAVDWVGALLLGYDPDRIPIAREAFGSFRWPLVDPPARGSDVRIVGDLGSGRADRLLAGAAPAGIAHPVGWRDAARAP